jgi:NTE family protein
MAANDGQTYFDLVCEGGGVKGIGLAGAYAVLEGSGRHPRNVAGTSAGAITAALIAAGYTSKELDDVVFNLDYRRFEDPTWEDKIPLIGKGLSIGTENGVYLGDEFEKWIRGMLADKHIHTFADLPADWEGATFPFRLQVVASDLTAGKMLVLPRDAGDLGIDPAKLEVAKAIRMSMSIPVFFEPVRWRNPATNHMHVIVDGGILSNYPIGLFDSPPGKEPRWPTFGLMLVEPDPHTPIGERLPEPEKAVRGPRGLIAMLTNIVHTMMEAHDRQYIDKSAYARTIPIPTLGVRTTEFDITKERTQALYQSGRQAATDFLKTWKFPEYKAAFRTGKEHSRRADIVRAQEAAAVKA